MNIDAKIQEMRDKKEASRNLVPDEQIGRMHVLWKKGRNLLASFFTELDMVRRQIGNDELFSDWCFYHLGVGVIQLGEVATVLKRDDADRIRNDLVAAKRAESDRLAAERHTRKLEKIERENEIARRRLENTEIEKAKIEESKRIKKAEIAAERKQRRAERTAKEGKPIVRARAAILANPTASRDAICQIAGVSPIIYAQARGQLVGENKLATNLVLLKNER
jgi:hypothetical protein